VFPSELIRSRDCPRMDQSHSDQPRTDECPLFSIAR